MKKQIHLIAGLTLILLCFLYAKPVRAAEDTITVSKTAGSEEIQAALKEAIGRDAGNPLTVIVPAGTHILESKLRIYSNTTLRLEDGAIMKSNFTEASNGAIGKEGAMLYGSHVNEDGNLCYTSACTHGGYSQFSNITIEGGIWDRGSNLETDVNTSIFILQHGQNITLRNLEVKHATNHFINLSGVKNALVENVTFRNQIVYSDKTDKSFWGKHTQVQTRYELCEVLHLDFLDKEGESKAYPVDNTSCQNVTVQNCTFDNVWSGVGTHHRGSLTSNNIAIKNNTFRNVKGRCVGAYGFKNTTITGNRFTTTNAASLSVFLYSHRSSGTLANNVMNGGQEFWHSLDADSYTVRSNRISGNRLTSIYLVSSPSSTITGNTISNAGKFAIRVVGKSKAVISGNSILTTKTESGISVGDSSVATIEGNTLKNIKNQGITIKSSGKNCIVRKNTIEKVGAIGILIENCGTGYQVTNNSVTNPGKLDLLVKNTKNCKVSGNTYYFTKSNVKYKVTTAKKYVTVLSATSKNVTSVTIPASVKSGIYTYKIKSISANAFKDCKKLKSIKISATTITSVGKNALKNIYPKAKMKVPASCLAKYKKLFKNKGQSKTFKISK